MTENRQSSIRFPLEETIWFQKGQEVAELLSISLDPNITIHEADQLVYIRGELELSGEYVIDTDNTDTDILSETKMAATFVQSVNSREDGVTEFIHSFPIDITVPRDRLKNINEVDVYVETFDYLLPENTCLKLNAQLVMTGMYEQQEEKEDDRLQKDEAEAEEEKSEKTPERIDDEHEQKNVQNFDEKEEVPLRVDENQEEKVEMFIHKNEEKQTVTSSPLSNREVGKKKNSETKKEEKREYEKQTDSREENNKIEDEEMYEPFQVEARKEKEEGPEVTLNNKQDQPINMNIFDYNAFEDRIGKLFKKSHKQAESTSSLPVESSSSPATTTNSWAEEESTSSSPVESSSSSSSETSVKEEKKDQEKEKEKSTKDKKSKKGISLTDFFARKEEDAAVSLKVCIVQEGETLDNIAEKYEVNVQQILRVNKLESIGDVREGQVLYIPKQHN